MLLATLTQRATAQGNVTTPHPILFVTQVPVPFDFITIGSTFGNHRGNIRSVARGGDLWIRYPDGTQRNLTQLAGYGNSGFQGASSIAVRDPCVHWSGTRAVFAMVQGATEQQYQHLTYYWRLYEITGLGQTDTPVITVVANQPSNSNNISPCYGSDDRILFTSDRVRDGSAHMYPPLDEYESTPIVSGIWSLDPSSGDLRLLNHAPSGDFTPIVDSFGRVMFTQWDHLQRDQLADADSVTPTYGTFNWSSEASNSVATASNDEVFPEPRPSRTDLLAGTNLRGHQFNHFFPWQMFQDGSGLETLNHIGRHELHVYFDFSINGDPNVHDFYVPPSVRNSLLNFFHIDEDPTQPGRYYATDAPEFYSHSAGQIVALTAPPGTNPDQITAEHLTHPDTHNQTSTPGPNHSGQYRDPCALSDGSLIAAHTNYTGSTTNSGSPSQPQTPFDFRLRTLVANGAYYEADTELTSGISKTVSWWSPDIMVSYSGPLWELSPVEVRARPVPPLTTEAADQPLPTPEQIAFTEAGVNPAMLRDYLEQRDLALITARDVTTRDHADQQQPFNLRVEGTTTQTVGASGTIYDVARMQLFQGDHLRSRGGASSPSPGRRVIAQPMHDPAALAAMPNNPNTPTGSVPIADDGSMAAFVPASRALTWQLTDSASEGVVRERYWLTFQPGEMRVCASCHGANTIDQANQPEPINTPQALIDLLQHWQQVTGPTLPAVAAGSVGGAATPENVLTIDDSHGGAGRRFDLYTGQPFTMQVAAPSAGPSNGAFALWARIGVPTPGEQVATASGTMLFPPAFLQPSNPVLFSLSNSLFFDAGALLPPANAPWSQTIPGLPGPIVMTLQGALLDATSPTGISVTNAVILRVQ
ncbi:MAG: hypothetical protein AB8H80_08805 [Planctomycetota bacterium]